ncbi:hypothetical protein BH23PAT1_BH23PAT1_0300 [soil metagenome]
MHFSRALLVGFAIGIGVFAGTAYYSSYGRDSSAQSSDYIRIKVSGYSGGVKVKATPGNGLGDCGKYFTAPKVCNTYNPPSNGISVVMDQATPSGYQFLGWSLISNNTDGYFSCTTSECFMQFSSGYGTIQMNFKAVSSPSPSPSPSPSSPTPRSTNLQGDTPPLQGSGSQEPAELVSTGPLEAPKQLTAVFDDKEATVNLTWEAPDPVEVSSYDVEISTDQKSWGLLASDITDTAFKDKEPAFETNYFYRVRAIGHGGEVSKWATAEITTGEFNPNVFINEGGKFRNEEGVTVTAAPESFFEDMYCYLSKPSDSPEVEDGWSLISGAYKAVCKNIAGGILGWLKPTEVEFDLTGIDDNYSSLGLYVDTGAGENSVITASSEANRGTFELPVETDAFSLVGQKKGASLWKILLLIMLFIAAIAVIVLVIVPRIILKRKLKSQYDDYWHKSQGT